jgi:hypothetical protein
MEVDASGELKDADGKSLGPVDSGHEHSRDHARIQKLCGLGRDTAFLWSPLGAGRSTPCPSLGHLCGTSFRELQLRYVIHLRGLRG